MRKFLTLGLLAVLVSCENRDINEGEEFRPREIHENISFHFDKVVVDGIEYLILEKDNNNPHEGFGFMAFRANKLMEKQDTLISYLKTIQHFQNKIYSRMYGLPLDSGQSEFDTKFLEFLDLENKELQELEKEDLTNSKEEE